MKNILFILYFIIYSCTPAFGAATTTITADSIRSSNRTKTWTPPSITDVLTGLTDVQTLTNKTLTSPTINTPLIDVDTFTEQGSTPSTPAAGRRKLYSKADGFYQLDSSGNETKVGSGSGSSYNLLSNGDFEGGSSNWNTDGTLSIVTNTTVIEGLKSGSITLNNTQYIETNSLTMKVGQALQQCQMTIKYVSPSFSDFYFTITDSSNTELIPSTSRVLGQVTSTVQNVKLLFVCPDVNQTLKLRIIATNNISDLRLDGAYLGLADFQTVPNVTSWKVEGPITITATTTNPTKGVSAVDKVESRQVGENYEILYTYLQTASTGASAGSGDYIFALPSGKTFPSGTLYFTGADPNVGTAQKIPCTSAMFFQDGSTYNGVGCTIVPYSSTTFRVYVYSVGASPSKQFINSTSYRLNFATMNYNFGFTFKGDGLSNSATVINAECPNIESCTDTFVANATNAGVVSELNVSSWVGNGSVSGTSVFTHTFKTNLFSVAPTCIVSPVQGTDDGFGKTAWIQSVSNTTLVIKTRRGDSTLTAYPYTFSCTRNTTDFKGKRVLQAEISPLYYFEGTVTTTSANNPIGVATVVEDQWGNWDNTNKRYTAKEGGIYEVSMGLSSIDINTTIVVWKNGVTTNKRVLYISSDGTQSTATLRLNANEYIDVRPTTSPVLTNGFLYIKRLGK